MNRLTDSGGKEAQVLRGAAAEDQRGPKQASLRSLSCPLPLSEGCPGDPSPFPTNPVPFHLPALVSAHKLIYPYTPHAVWPQPSVECFHSGLFRSRESNDHIRTSNGLTLPEAKVLRLTKKQDQTLGNPVC